MGSKPYAKELYEGIEYALPPARDRADSRAARQVAGGHPTIPAIQGIGENGADFGVTSTNRHESSTPPPNYCPDVLYSTSAGESRGTILYLDLAPTHLTVFIPIPSN
jgi:hypothetical protein